MLRALAVSGLGLTLLLPAAPAAAEPSVSEVQQQIDKSATQLEEIVESYNKIREEMKATQSAMDSLTTQLQPLEQQAASTGAEVAEIAATAYKSGQPNAANALLQGASSASLVDRLAVLDRLARDRRQRVSAFTDSSRRLTEEKQKLAAVRTRQAGQAKELETRKAKIESDLKKLYELRRQAYGRATAVSSGGHAGAVPNVSGQAGAAVRFAYGAIGKPYAWAADGPGSYDCSGLTLAAWRAAGKSLPHQAAMQWNRVSHLSRSQLQPGDLVFYNGLAHVGIYVGSGKIIHAPTFGEHVKLASVDVMTPYGYGRVR